MNRNYLFIALLAAGILLSTLVRYLFSGIWGGAGAAALAVTICITCMGGYAAMTWNDKDYIDRSRHAENLYYMGFMFTLISLIYSLITLFLLPAAAAVDERVYNLIGSFGIALLSTFAGILLRILLLQWGEGDDAMSSTAGGRAGLSGAAQLTQPDILARDAFELRMILLQTTADMRSFCTAVKQAADQTKAEIEQTKADIGDSVVTAAEQMQTAVQDQGGIITALSTKIDQSGEKLAAAAVALESATAKCTELLDSTGKLTAAVITPQISEQYEQSATALKREVEKWQSMTDEVRTSLVQAVKKLTDTIARG